MKPPAPCTPQYLHRSCRSRSYHPQHSRHKTSPNWCYTSYHKLRPRPCILLHRKNFPDRPSPLLHRTSHRSHRDSGHMDQAYRWCHPRSTPRCICTQTHRRYWCRWRWRHRDLPQSRTHQCPHRWPLILRCWCSYRRRHRRNRRCLWRTRQCPHRWALPPRCWCRL